MGAIREIVVITSDLMFASRLTSVLSPNGVSLRTQSTDWEYEPSSTVVVDLNSDAGGRLALIRAVRTADPHVPIIGVGRHDDDQCRRDAMAAGATRVVTNGSLQSVAVRLIGAPTR